MTLQILFYRHLMLGAVVIAISAVSAFGENLSSVQGSFSGFGVGVVQGGTLMASDGGSGTASQIGRFTFSMVKIANLATLTGSGGFVMAFPNGDKLYGSIFGAGDLSNPAHEVINLTIAGGTGRFQGATGSLTFDRTIDFSTLPAFESNYGIVKGTISTPGPSDANTPASTGRRRNP